MAPHLLLPLVLSYAESVRAIDRGAAVIRPVQVHLKGVAVAAVLAVSAWSFGQAAAPERVIGEGQIVRGWLGLDARDFVPPPPSPYYASALYGALVDAVPADSPAAAAGLLPGDLIIRYGNTAVVTAAELNRLVSGTPPGTLVDMLIIRGGNERKLTAEIGWRDDRLLVVAGPPLGADALGGNSQ